MKASKKPTPETIKLAKKAGFKKKAPKKPSSRSMAVMSSYIQRWNDWCKDVNKAAAQGRKYESLKKQFREVGR